MNTLPNFAKCHFCGESTRLEQMNFALDARSNSTLKSNGENGYTYTNTIRFWHKEVKQCVNEKN